MEVDKNQWSISLRPKTFNDMYGHDKLKAYFENIHKNKENYPTAILLKGQYGSGKSTAGNIIAASIVCQHPHEDGSPCGECASCKAIFDEMYNRDVIQIDGGTSSKADVIDMITSFVSTPPMKDKAKVVILEEVQELSNAAKNSLLKLIEAKRPKIHYIFTSMENLKGSGFTSRCVKFNFPFMGITDIMIYLHQTLKKLGLWETLPKEFQYQGLQIIAENSNGSLREALQNLQTCIRMNALTVEEIQKNIGLVNVSEFYNLMLLMVDGKIENESLFTSLFESENYQDTVNLCLKAISDSEIYRVFRKIPENSAYFKDTIIGLANHRNFAILRDGFNFLQQNNPSYLKKSVFQLAMCDIIDKCRMSNNNGDFNSAKTKPAETQSNTPVRRRVVN